MHTRRIGGWGEQLVIKWLRKQGYNTIAHNYYTRWGEIDIVATQPAGLSFIEVKLRVGGPTHNAAERAITPTKLLHWQRAAQWFCVAEQTPETTRIFFEQVSVYVDRVRNTVLFRKYILD